MAKKNTFPKRLLWVLGIIPAILIYSGLFNDWYGANPIEEITHLTGLWALFFLCFSLSCTPVLSYFHLPWVFPLRRISGLLCYFYALNHLWIYTYIDWQLDWIEIYYEVIGTPYLIIGLVATLLLTLLAITSNKISQRRLKKLWSHLHKSVYLIAVLGLVHFFLLVKADYSDPIYFLLIISLLLSHRIIRKFIANISSIQVLMLTNALLHDSIILR